MKCLVVAPHPDDEVLGCGGTLLRRKSEGAQLAWIIVTGMSTEGGWPRERVLAREEEIDAVAEKLGFDFVYQLQIPTTKVEVEGVSALVRRFSGILDLYEPNEIFIPYRYDAHTDHQVVSGAMSSCVKWFRCPSVRRVLAYETLSETDAALGQYVNFRPNYYVDISAFLENKVEVMSIYASELEPFPFPRSPEAIRAKAQVRGIAAGYKAAEAFELLVERA